MITDSLVSSQAPIRTRLLWIGLALALLRPGSAGWTAEPGFPDPSWPQASPASAGLDEQRLHQARDYALSGEGSGLIVHQGKLVLAWGDPDRRYDLKSTTKSFGAAALAIALRDGKVTLDDPAILHHPGFGKPPDSNLDTGWIPAVTLRHLALHTAGFEKPGGFQPLGFKPGTRWAYSDAGPNWLAECLTLVYRRDLNDLLFERLFTPIGITEEDLVWRKHAYRPDLLDGLKRREFGSGISANVDAMARFGYLFLHRGQWNGRRLLPAAVIRDISKTDPSLLNLPVDTPGEYGNASMHYGLLWWNNADGTLPGVPRDAYWSWGLYDSLIVVMPSLDLVVARAGRSLQRQPGWGHYEVLKPFLEPIAAAAGFLPPDPQAAAHPPSPVIRSMTWDPAASIGRAAPGSDNWPMTWADDDHLYTAYVYVYSQDANDAYTSADRMVLARVPADRMTRRDAYQFFVRLDDKNQPVWTNHIQQRGAVFASPGRCYRSGITYNAGLKRYLCSQILPGEDTRFAGGFAIYDAPQPWGPWTTAFHEETWDVAPGESSSFPQITSVTLGSASRVRLRRAMKSFSYVSTVPSYWPFSPCQMSFTPIRMLNTSGLSSRQSLSQRAAS